MKVTHVTTRVLSTPADNPLVVGLPASTDTRLADMGFRQMKMQCGSGPTVAASVERVCVVREAIGPGVDLTEFRAIR